MKCRKGYDICVCKSNAGWYKGTKDENGMPNCRLTAYTDSAESAEGLAYTREFGCIENDHCHGGYGCISKG